MRAIRGAITAENTQTDILEGAEQLLTQIMLRNNLAIDDIISITFTCTKDLNAAYPAAAARNMGIVRAALMCVQEMDVAGSMAKVVRVCVLAEANTAQTDVAHVYLRDAAHLRPDLQDEDC